MIKKIIIPFILLLLILLKSLQANELNKYYIVAIVNDQIITNYDLEQRMQILTSSANITLNRENIRSLKIQIREILINESLQKIAAKKIGIEVAEEEIDNSLQEIASGNKITLEKLEGFLKQRLISIEALKKQIRARLLWQKLILSSVRSQIEINDIEIDEYIESLKDGDNIVEVKLQKILIPLQSNISNDSSNKLALKIHNNILKNKDNFAIIAKELPNNSVINNESDAIKWYNLKNLNKNIRPYIMEMTNGELRKPIKTDQGYYILLLHDKRIITNQDINSEYYDEVRRKIFLEKLEMAANKYLRNLQRSSFIERKEI